MYKLLIFSFFVLLAFGCKKNSTTTLQNIFPGYYKAQKITSDIAVDMNNDGLKSSDLYSEISSPFTTLNGQQMPFYNFESINNYIEVRPLPRQGNHAQLIAFNFPHQVIDYLNGNTPFLMHYANEFINYSYEFIGYNSIDVTSSNQEYTNQIGEINSLSLKENGDLTVTLQKKVFDFADKPWKKINIIAEYLKIP